MPRKDKNMKENYIKAFFTGLFALISSMLGILTVPVLLMVACNVLEEYRKKGIPLREFPTRKDYTDTHLAVKYAVDLKPQKVTILGATGTRYDHALANISLLAFLKDNGIEAKIVDVHNEIEMLHGPNKAFSQPFSRKWMRP